MSLFKKKSPEEKAEQKAAKKQRDEEVQARIKEIRTHFSSVERMSYTMVLGHTASRLRSEEKILMVATGIEDESDKNGLLIATDQRIVIGTAKGINFSEIELPYDSIDKVDTGVSLRGEWVTLYNGSQKTTLEKSVTKDLSRLRDIVREKQKEASSPAAAPVAASGADEIKKLAELHAAGVLTDDEFASAKAKALGL